MELTPEAVKIYREKMGDRSGRTLSILGKHQPFVQAMKSDLGKELMADLLESHEYLLEKISDLKATDEEKISYKVIRRLINIWSARIVDYENKMKEIKYVAERK